MKILNIFKLKRIKSKQKSKTNVFQDIKKQNISNSNQKQQEKVSNKRTKGQVFFFNSLKTKSKINLIDNQLGFEETNIKSFSEIDEKELIMNHLIVINSNLKILISKSLSQTAIISMNNEFYERILSISRVLFYENMFQINKMNMMSNININNINYANNSGYYNTVNISNFNKNTKNNSKAANKTKNKEVNSYKPGLLEEIKENSENTPFSIMNNLNNNNQILNSLSVSNINKAIFSQSNINKDKDKEKDKDKDKSQYSIKDTISKNDKSNIVNWKYILINNTKIIFLIVNQSMIYLGIFPITIPTSQCRIYLLNIFSSFMNYNFSESTLHKNFLEAKPEDVIKIRLFEVVWLKNIHFQLRNIISSLSSIKTGMYFNGIKLKTMYIIGYTSSIFSKENMYLLYNFNKKSKSQLKSYKDNLQIDYLKNELLLNEIIFQSNCLYDKYMKLNSGGIDENKDNSYTEKNELYFKIELTSTYPRLIIIIKFLPLLNGLFSIHIYTQKRLSRQIDESDQSDTNTIYSIFNNLNAVFSNYKEFYILFGNEKKNRFLQNSEKDKKEIRKKASCYVEPLIINYIEEIFFSYICLGRSVEKMFFKNMLQMKYFLNSIMFQIETQIKKEKLVNNSQFNLLSIDHLHVYLNRIVSKIENFIDDEYRVAAYCSPNRNKTYMINENVCLDEIIYNILYNTINIVNNERGNMNNHDKYDKFDEKLRENCENSPYFRVDSIEINVNSQLISNINDLKSMLYINKDYILQEIVYYLTRSNDDSSFIFSDEFSCNDYSDKNEDYNYILNNISKISKHEIGKGMTSNKYKSYMINKERDNINSLNPQINQLSEIVFMNNSNKSNIIKRRRVSVDANCIKKKGRDLKKRAFTLGNTDLQLHLEKLQSFITITNMKMEDKKEKFVSNEIRYRNLLVEYFNNNVVLNNPFVVDNNHNNHDYDANQNIILNK